MQNSILESDHSEGKYFTKHFIAKYYGKVKTVFDGRIPQYDVFVKIKMFYHVDITTESLYGARPDQNQVDNGGWRTEANLQYGSS